MYVFMINHKPKVFEWEETGNKSLLNQSQVFVDSSSSATSSSADFVALKEHHSNSSFAHDGQVS